MVQAAITGARKFRLAVENGRLIRITRQAGGPPTVPHQPIRNHRMRSSWRNARSQPWVP
jgi:hypothetical protein